MHLDFIIRAGRPEDADRLAVLSTQVWLHTYATDGITADIAEYVLDALTPGAYRAMLQDTNVRILVAERGDGLAGLAVVTHAASCPVDAPATVELQTLYVQAHCIGHGLGRSLLQAAEAEASARSGSALWLTVNARNARAIAFYARQGYTKIGTTYFTLGDGRHENHVLIGPGA